MTGPVSLDHLTFNDNTISTNSSNTNLELNPAGSGTIELQASTNITGSVDITGTLTTDDVTTAGNIVVTGRVDADYVRLKDNKITTNASNADLEISANGTGVIDIKNPMTTVAQTVTGNISVTGRADVDNIRIDTNTISTTNSNGGLTISPNGSGALILDATTISVPGIMDISTALLSNTLFMGIGAKIQANQTNQDVILESNGTGSIVVDQISITDNKITTHVSNADLQLDTDGTGLIDILTPTQTTVGSAGGANALPATPTGYIKIKIAGTTRVIPFYDEA